MNKQFEALMEGQKKAMEFWTGMSEQMTDAFTRSGKKDEEGQYLLREWFEKQQELFKEMMSGGDPQKAFQNAPDQFRKWMEFQTEFTEKWMEYYKSAAGKFGLKAPGFNGGEFIPTQLFQNNLSQWRNWMENGNQFMRDQVMSKLPFNMQPHFANFLDAYNTMAHYWEPISRMIQNGIFEQHVIEKYFTKDAYHRLVNQVMGFKPVGNPSEVIENVNQWFEKFFNFNQEEWSDWNSVSENWKKQMKNFAEKGNLPVYQMVSEFSNRLRDQLLPFYNVMGKGRQSEIVKLMRDIQFAYVSFILKSSELQTKVYEAGQFVMPDSMKTLYIETKEGKTIPNYQDFFKQYINELEDAILKTLHSEEYSLLQSEVAATGTKIKLMTDNLMELTLVDLPFLTRTDGDDIARETTSLRKKIRTLEDRLSELEKTLLPAGKPSAARESGKPDDPKKKLFERIGMASPAERDDLKAVKGIGPKLEKMLNELGVFTLKQISKMTDKEYDLIDELLDAFQGRAKRDDWAGQAGALMKTELEA